jgi:hypothetical protein
MKCLDLSEEYSVEEKQEKLCNVFSGSIADVVP